MQTYAVIIIYKSSSKWPQLFTKYTNSALLNPPQILRKFSRNCSLSDDKTFLGENDYKKFKIS